MKLSENTYVSITLVLSLIGAAGFVTRIHFQTQANAESYKELKDDIKSDLKEIKDDLKTIREKMEKI
jgi:sensor domain CHASE-containing protein